MNAGQKNCEIPTLRKEVCPVCVFHTLQCSVSTNVHSVWGHMVERLPSFLSTWRCWRADLPLSRCSRLRLLVSTEAQTHHWREFWMTLHYTSSLCGCTGLGGMWPLHSNENPVTRNKLGDESRFNIHTWPLCQNLHAYTVLESSRCSINVKWVNEWWVDELCVSRWVFFTWIFNIMWST